ncbi:MAG: ferritin family protein [Candidatus Krumholzibacteriia bacterium]
MKTVDIVKIAIENEVRARIFYGKAADLTSEGESQMVFLELVEMEDGHARRVVNDLGEIMRSAGQDPTAFLEQKEAELARDLPVEESELIKNGEMRAVIEFAIGREALARDSYRELADLVDGEQERRVCEELAEEEQRHHDMLSKLRQSVDTPMDERPAL